MIWFDLLSFPFLRGHSPLINAYNVVLLLLQIGSLSEIKQRSPIIAGDFAVWGCSVPHQCSNYMYAIKNWTQIEIEMEKHRIFIGDERVGGKVLYTSVNWSIPPGESNLNAEWIGIDVCVLYVCVTARSPFTQLNGHLAHSLNGLKRWQTDDTFQLNIYHTFWKSACDQSNRTCNVSYVLVVLVIQRCCFANTAAEYFQCYLTCTCIHVCCMLDTILNSRLHGAHISNYLIFAECIEAVLRIQKASHQMQPFFRTYSTFTTNSFSSNRIL